MGFLSRLAACGQVCGSKGARSTFHLHGCYFCGWWPEASAEQQLGSCPVFFTGRGVVLKSVFSFLSLVLDFSETPEPLVHSLKMI